MRASFGDWITAKHHDHEALCSSFIGIFFLFPSRYVAEACHGEQQETGAADAIINNWSVFTMKPSSKAHSEQHRYFPSGDWEGFYNDPRSGGKKGNMAMTLEFAGGHITGSGSDPVGAYTWTGTYDTKAETCALTKRYAGAHSVEYSGYADENGIWGKWSIRKMAAGAFHIWPKKSEMGAGAEEEEQNSKEVMRDCFFAGKIACCLLLAVLLHNVSIAQNQRHPKTAKTIINDCAIPSGDCRSDWRWLRGASEC
ncbi:MAG TPA: hypothetical protein VN616_09485 [Puia sp.]|nr:hypothetical protein [Puia sp.]